MLLFMVHARMVIMHEVRGKTLVTWLKWVDDLPASPALSVSLESAGEKTMPSTPHQISTRHLNLRSQNLKPQNMLRFFTWLE